MSTASTVAAVALAAERNAQAGECYVATTDDDGAPGTIEAPLPTLQGLPLCWRGAAPPLAKQDLVWLQAVTAPVGRPGLIA